MYTNPESLRLIEEIMRHALIPMPERTDQNLMQDNSNDKQLWKLVAGPIYLYGLLTALI